MTASTAATNGCRFAASVALFAPIRWIERNQKTFVSTRGPIVAKTISAQISHPRSHSWSGVCVSPLSRMAIQAPGMTSALMCEGEYVLSSGPTTTE